MGRVFLPILATGAATAQGRKQARKEGRVGFNGAYYYAYRTVGMDQGDGSKQTMSGSYIGGHTVITVRRGPKDMERRKAHWKRKLEREQLAHDAERHAQQEEMDKRIAVANQPSRRQQINREKYKAWQKRKVKGDGRQAS
jgi:hypothetical protein